MNAVQTILPPLATAEAELQAAATRAVENMIACRMAAYKHAPRKMDAIFPDLSAMTPKAALAKLEELRKFELEHRGRVGFGGEVPIINILAAQRLLSKPTQEASP